MNEESKKVFWAELLKWCLIAGITFALISLILRPFRKEWSQNYLSEGDAFLIQKKYISAELQYEKGLLLNKNDNKFKDRISLCKNASTDPLVLEDFYKEKNLSMALSKLDLARSIPESVTEAVGLAKSLIEGEEYQLAVIAAQNSTEMEKGFRDAWLYLGIANLKTVQNVELVSEDRRNYLERGKTALNTAKALDPQYKPTLDYLALAEELEK